MGVIVQVFGLQRSGTNYLHDIIALNLPVEATRDAAGWKHGFPHQSEFPDTKAPPQERPIRDQLDHLGVTPIVVRKDLDHWLASIQRLPRDIEKTHGFTWADPAQTWHDFYDAWSFAPIVRYEDFLADFDASLRRLGDLLGVTPLSYLGVDKVQDSPDWESEHVSRYL